MSNLHKFGKSGRKNDFIVTSSDTNQTRKQANNVEKGDMLL